MFLVRLSRNVKWHPKLARSWGSCLRGTSRLGMVQLSSAYAHEPVLPPPSLKPCKLLLYPEVVSSLAIVMQAVEQLRPSAWGSAMYSKPWNQS